MFRLDGKIALVTGASYGIGFAIAKGLANAGAKVVFNDINKELVDKGIARHGYDVCDAEGNVIGYVTSGTMGPSVGKAIGMAYVAAPLFKVDSEIYIKVREKLLKAKVVKTPFYKK